MIWATPWAWALAALAVLPIVAHLWSRKQPRTVAFPTLRFLRAASPVSRRLHRVQDWPLLLLRLAIVMAIAAAAAGPTVASAWRDAAWRARLHRVIVLDAAVPADRGTRIVDDLRAGAASSVVVGPGEVVALLDEGIAQAARASRLMRTELAIVWPGDRASVSTQDVADVPRSVGVRLVAVESSTSTSDRDVPAGPPSVTIEATPDDLGTRDVLQTRVQGLRLPAPNAGPVMVRWPGVDPRVPAATKDAPTMASQALEAVASDPRVRDAADRSLDGRAATASGTLTSVVDDLATSLEGVPLLRGWVDDGRIVIGLDADATSPLGWWSIVAAAEALVRFENIDAAAPWTAEDIARAQREPAMPETSSLPGGLDTRVMWGLALGLLMIEQIARRRQVPPEVSDAA
jgi:hypothetical protein